MQLVHSSQFEFEPKLIKSVRFVLISTEDAGGPIGQKIGLQGGIFEQFHDLFAGLEALIDDPAGYALAVLDCDCYGGINEGLKAHALLGGVSRRVPAILVSAECSSQSFPEEKEKPILLRGPLSSVSFRVGFEHALRERMIYNSMAMRA